MGSRGLWLYFMCGECQLVYVWGGKGRVTFLTHLTHSPWMLSVFCQDPCPPETAIFFPGCSPYGSPAL